MIVELFAGPLDGRLVEVPAGAVRYRVHLAPAITPSSPFFVELLSAVGLGDAPASLLEARVGYYAPGPPQLPGACTGRPRPPQWLWSVE